MKYILAFSLIIIIFAIYCSFIHNAYSQVPDDIQRYRLDKLGTNSASKKSKIDGNRIATIVLNDGQVGHWPDEPSMQWPRDSGTSYLIGQGFLVAAEFIAPGNNQVVHSVATSYRIHMARDPITSLIWGFAPIPDYSSTNATSMACSWDSNTWPNVWPTALNLSTDWNGAWYGYHKKNEPLGSNEVFFVMDDSQDYEWTRSPYNYFPIINDSMRGGLGLRVEVREFEWADSVARDILFLHYKVINLSDTDYSKVSIGVFSDPGIGGSNDVNDDCVVFDSTHGIVYAFDSDGKTPVVSQHTGYMGYILLKSPGIDSTVTIVTPKTVSLFPYSTTEWWPSNDESLWRKMTSGNRDTSLLNTDVAFIMSTGPYTFGKWTQKIFSIAIVFADSLDGLFRQAEVARKIAANDYYLPADLITSVEQKREQQINNYSILQQNFPNPFNPFTTIRYHLPQAGLVTLSVYDVLGKQVASLVNSYQNAGAHQIVFDGSTLSSGVYYYRIQKGSNVDTKKLLLLK